MYETYMCSTLLESLEDGVIKDLGPTANQAIDKDAEQGNMMDAFRTMDGILEGVPVAKLNSKRLHVFKENGLIDFDETGDVYFTQQGINWLSLLFPEIYKMYVHKNPRLQKFKQLKATGEA